MFKTLLSRLKKIDKQVPFLEKITIIFSQPILLLLLPRTYWRLFCNVLRKNSNDDYVIGYSPHMAIVFTWYFRVAKCIKKYGRNGYVYEDGLGSSLKERFWLNPLTLKIFAYLKIRKFCLLGSVLLFGGILVIGFLQQIAVYKLLLLLFLIGGSPLYLIPFFRLAKPETLSWTLFLPTLYSFVTGHYVICAIGGLGIAILNFTVTLLLIETVFLVSISTSNLGWGMLVSALPILKLLLDLTPFFKKSYIKELRESLGEKKATSRSDNVLQFGIKGAYLALIYIIVSCFFLTKPLPLTLLILLINPLAILIINRKLFRFADDHTFFRFFFVVVTLLVILQPILINFLAYLLLIYLSPLGLLEKAEDVIKDYPHLKPYSIRQSSAFLMNIFSQLRPGSRIIFEAKDTEKTLSGFTLLLYYFEFFLTKKDIELLPMEWLRITQLDYFMNEYVKINEGSPIEIINEKIRELGATYIMVYSEQFLAELKNHDFREVLSITSDQIKQNISQFNELNIPQDKNLYVLEPPFSTSLIEPETAITRTTNRMSFFAKQKTEYIIKCTYHPSWEARQNDQKINVYQAEHKLSYLALYSQIAGEIELIFNQSRFK